MAADRLPRHEARAPGRHVPSLPTYEALTGPGVGARFLRIPFLATTSAGTVLAGCDANYMSTGDSADHIDAVGGRALAMCTAWLAEPNRPTAVVCSTGYLALTLQIAALRAGVAVPDELEIVSIGDVPDEAHLLGRVSYFGVDDVFARIADIIMERATQPGGDGPGVVHEFTWRYFPGETTREGAGSTA